MVAMDPMTRERLTSKSSQTGGNSFTKKARKGFFESILNKDEETPEEAEEREYQEGAESRHGSSRVRQLKRKGKHRAVSMDSGPTRWSG